MKITVNGKVFEAKEGQTVLEAAKENGVYIPTLCAYEGLKPKAACKLCAVIADGEERLACMTRVSDGMSIVTDSEELFSKRKAIVTEMFRQHRVDCHHCMRIGSTLAKDFNPDFCKDCYFCDCVRDGFCELQAKALEFGIDVLPFEIHEHDFEPDLSTGSVIREPNKCIRCRRCTDICKAQGVGILGTVKTENGQVVGAETSLMEDGCVRCGRCVSVCPTGALFLTEHKDEAVYYAHQYGTPTAAMLCSCVIPELERLYKVPEGSIDYEQLVAAVRKLGIDKVYDPAFAKHGAMNSMARMLDERLGKGCVIMTDDYAAKNFLMSRFPELEGSFLFGESKQEYFGAAMRRENPGAKLYHISTRASFAAEAKETGDVDYYIGARELYRILLRTGANPVKRRPSAADKIGFERCDRYEALFRAGGWKVSGSAEELRFTENGREYRALICHNLGQVKKAVEKMDEYDVIKVVG